MTNLKYYISTLVLFLATTAVAQIEFTTAVSKNKLGVNQRFRIEFTVNQQGADNFEAPNFENFRVVGGPSSSVNQSWINGKASYAQSYIYILQPKNTGEFVIGSATIEYKGKTIKSNKVKITVLDAVEIPKDPNDPNYIAQQNIHLVAEVSKLSPYVGEGIYVVYKLFVSENISVNDWRVSESPEYSGFWNQDIEVKDVNVKNGTYNGKKYRYIELKRAVLIPQQEGKLKIEPMKMDFAVGIPTGRRDFFGNPQESHINFSLASQVKIVQAKPLPLEGKPLDFSGAVGDFEFKVVSNKSELKANAAAQIKVSITGKGNLKLFDIPKITTPPELEVYTPEYNEKVVTTLSGLRGTITDSYTVVPQFKGKYKIPDIAFSYFNPKEKKYKTIAAPAIFLDVTEGKELVTGTNENTNKQQVVVSNENFRFIAINTSFQNKIKKQFLNTTGFYLLLLLPFLAIPIGVSIGKKRAKRAGDVFGNRIRKADKLARKYLSEAKKQLGNQEAFYIALEKALHNFLKAKLHVETADISKEHISEMLQKKKVPAETIKEFIDVLNDCDFARYTPTTNVMMKQEFDKAKNVIAKIDKYL